MLTCGTIDVADVSGDGIEDVILATWDFADLDGDEHDDVVWSSRGYVDVWLSTRLDVRGSAFIPHAEFGIGDETTDLNGDGWLDDVHCEETTGLSVAFATP